MRNAVIFSSYLLAFSSYASAINTNPCISTTILPTVTVSRRGNGDFVNEYTRTFDGLYPDGLKPTVYTVTATCTEPGCQPPPMETAPPPGFTCAIVECDKCGHGGGQMTATLTFPLESLDAFRSSGYIVKPTGHPSWGGHDCHDGGCSSDNKWPSMGPPYSNSTGGGYRGHHGIGPKPPYIKSPVPPAVHVPEVSHGTGNQAPNNNHGYQGSGPKEQRPDNWYQNPGNTESGGGEEFVKPPAAASSDFGGDTSSPSRQPPGDIPADNYDSYEAYQPHTDETSYNKSSNNPSPTGQSSDSSSAKDGPSGHTPPKVDEEPKGKDSTSPSSHVANTNLSPPYTGPTSIVSRPVETPVIVNKADGMRPGILGCFIAIALGVYAIAFTY